MRQKRSAQSSGPGLCRFHDGSLLLPFRTWEERQQHNLPISTRRLKRSPIRHYSMMFCCTTKSAKKRRTQKKLPIGSFNPVSQSHPKAKAKKDRGITTEVGPVVAQSVLDFFASTAGKKTLRRMKELGIHPKTEKVSAKKAAELPLAGKTFVLTGDIALDDARRSDRKD